MKKSQNKNVILLGAFVVIVLGAITFFSRSKSNNPTPETAQVYWTKTDNTYTYDAEYEVPGHIVQDTFTITLDDAQNVTDVSPILPAEIGKHEEGVQEFFTELRPLIVGRNIQDIGEFDTISGSSLTTDAFNEGLKLLQQQMQAQS